MSTPSRRIRSGCCARAITGHAAAPPSRRVDEGVAPPNPSQIRMCRFPASGSSWKSFAREGVERRVASIQKVVLSAVAKAEAEAEAKQVDDHEADPTRRAELTSVEKHFVANERRLVQLKDHLAFLRSIEIAVRVNE
jgi:hypothetical protein